MKMPTAHARRRVDTARFGVLATVDETVGTHTVPVVFSIKGDWLVIPIDTVKDKKSLQLRRVRNLENEPRCSLLVDHRDDDWGQLWWVRLDLAFDRQDTADEVWRSRLATKYPVYQTTGAVDSLLYFAIDQVSGWQATAQEFESPERR